MLSCKLRHSKRKLISLFYGVNLTVNISVSCGSDFADIDIRRFIVSNYSNTSSSSDFKIAMHCYFVQRFRYYDFAVEMCYRP